MISHHELVPVRARRRSPGGGAPASLVPLALALAALTSCATTAPGSAAAAAAAAGAAPAAVEPVKVQVFIMSKCPFSAEVMISLGEAKAVLGDAMDLSIDYIASEREGELVALHGEEELRGNIVQLCAAEHYPTGQVLELITGSPTWLANNRHQFHAITAEQIKANLCQHNDGLQGCDETLSDDSTNQGSCGQ